MKINQYTQPLLSPDEGGDGEAPTLGSILENFGAAQGDEGAAQGEPNQEPNQEPTPMNTNEPNGEGEPTPEPEPEDPKNAAFANMRVKNNQLSQSNSTMEGLINKVAKAMGLEGENINDLMTKLDDVALSKLAQKDNVPVEMYKRLNDLEQRDAQFQQIQLQSVANKSFADLQSEFGLTQKELVDYGTQLDAAGLNPFAKAMDIRADYVSRNLDKIIEKKVQASLARDAKGDNHSSTPSNKSGGDGAAAPAVTTTQGLKTLLNGFNG
jgi:LysM repeat protein